jgi:hypothetical protein
MVKVIMVKEDGGDGDNGENGDNSCVIIGMMG